MVRVEKKRPGELGVNYKSNLIAFLFFLNISFFFPSMIIGFVFAGFYVVFSVVFDILIYRLIINYKKRKYEESKTLENVDYIDILDDEIYYSKENRKILISDILEVETIRRYYRIMDRASTIPVNKIVFKLNGGDLIITKKEINLDKLEFAISGNLKLNKILHKNYVWGFYLNG